MDQRSADMFMSAFTLVMIALGIVLIIAQWKIYTKAGQPGWAVLIPVYNVLILLRIIGRPWWWLLLMFIPLVNIVILFIVMIDLAKSFGQGVGFGVGLVLFGFIFFPILGFGDSRYLGPAALVASGA